MAVSGSQNNSTEAMQTAHSRNITCCINNKAEKNVIMKNIKKNSQLLIEAAQNGNIEEVDRLIPLSDPKARDSLALRWAAGNGHVECVKLLIPVSDPKSCKSYALQMAAAMGHVQCVRLLIPVSRPKDDNSLALRSATRCAQNACVDLLFEVSDPIVALDLLKKESVNNTEKWQYLEEKINEKQQEMLNAVVETTSVQWHIKHSRKI